MPFLDLHGNVRLFFESKTVCKDRNKRTNKLESLMNGPVNSYALT